MGVRWNTGLMQNLGIRVETRVGQLGRTDRDGHEWFPLREAGGLEFSVRDAALQKFVGGSLRLSGGYVLRLADGGMIDLRDATLRVNASNPLVLDVVSSDGKVWFFTDRIMFELVDNNRTLKVHTADLRVTSELARRMHAPESEGWGLGDFAMDTEDFTAGHKITVPLLVIWGARSHTEGVHGDVLSVWKSRYATDAWGGAINCGHYVPEEAPDETFDYLMRHFRG